MNPVPLSVADRIRALSVCPVLSGIPPESRAILAEMMHTERLHQGEILFHAGDPGDRVYVIVSGSVSVTPQDHLTPVRTLATGSLFGEYEMLLRRGRTATIAAELDTTLLSLDYVRFRAFLIQFPASALELLRVAVERLIIAEAKLRKASEHGWA